MRPRATELGLIILASSITIAIYALVGLGEQASLRANIVPFLVVVLALLGLAHMAIRRFAARADGVLLPIAVLLNGIGYVFIARLDEDLAALQATWTAIGIGAFVATLVAVPRIRDLQRYRWTFAALGLGLLLLPLLPVIGQNINGARLWVRIGPMTLQPGEFAKIALGVFFAGYLVERREVLALGIGRLRLPDPRHLGPVLAAWIASLIVMVAERDLGSSLLFFTLFVVMVWVATGRAWYLALGFGLFGLGAVVSWRLFDHVRERVDVWLDPWTDVAGDGFQIVQAIFALASGGLIGTGPGLGSPERIPAAETDFIYAVIGEELGLVGATAVLIAFMLMVGTGLRIATQAPSEFESLLAVGLTAILGVQAFVIIGGVLRVVPLTGITLPFVSYGGSSLLANYILLALLVRISHDSARERVAVLK